MTDLQRKNVKIFAINSGAQGTSEFGSLKSTGNFVFSQDINDLQTSEYETGWRGAVVNGKTPTIPDFNAISRVISEQVAYLYQKGIAEWSSEQTYFIGNKCMVINNGVPQEYYSLTDNNIGNNPLNDTINWKNINDLIFENISNNYVVLDGSNATFTNLSETTKETLYKNIFSLIQTTDSTKIGYYTFWWNGNNYTLPAGGTWLVWSIHQQSYDTFSNVGQITSAGCGLFAGGSTITYGSAYTIGWAIRVQ